MTMMWILGAALLALFVYSTVFRRFTSGLLLLAALGGVIYLLHQHEKELSRSRIPFSQIAVEEVALNPEFRMYQISGRITNRSPSYTLKQVVLAVTMQEVATNSPGDHITLGEATKEIYLDLPPGQTVDFTDSVYFPTDQPPPQSRLQWTCTVVQSEAE